MQISRMRDENQPAGYEEDEHLPNQIKSDNIKTTDQPTQNLQSPSIRSEILNHQNTSRSAEIENYTGQQQRSWEHRPNSESPQSINQWDRHQCAEKRRNENKRHTYQV